MVTFEKLEKPGDGCSTPPSHTLSTHFPPACQGYKELGQKSQLAKITMRSVCSSLLTHQPVNHLKTRNQVNLPRRMLSKPIQFRFQGFASCPLNNLLSNSARNVMAELMDATLLVCGLSDLLSLSLKTQQSSISGLLVFLLCVMISQRSQAVGLPLHLRVLPVSTVESRRARDVNPADNWSLTCSPVPYLMPG